MLVYKALQMRQLHEAFQDYHKELLSCAIKENWDEYGLLKELQFDSPSHSSTKVTQWQLALVSTHGLKAQQLPHSGCVESFVCVSLSRWWGFQNLYWTWIWETTAKFWIQLTQLWSLTLCRFCIIPMVSSHMLLWKRYLPPRRRKWSSLRCWFSFLAVEFMSCFMSTNLRLCASSQNLNSCCHSCLILEGEQLIFVLYSNLRILYRP